jgi:hypothetical protein
MTPNRVYSPHALQGIWALLLALLRSCQHALRPDEFGPDYMAPRLVYSPFDKEFEPDSAVRPKASHWTVRRSKARIRVVQTLFTNPPAPARLPSRCSHAQVGGSITEHSSAPRRRQAESIE